MYEEYPERKKWLNEYWTSFPPQLTHLRYNMMFWSSSLNEVAFPVQLQRLELVINQFKFEWIFSLPHLHTLMIKSLEWSNDDDGIFATYAWEDEGVFERKKHRTLKRLHLLYHPIVENFEGFDSQTLHALLASLPVLEELAVQFDDYEGELEII